MPNPMRTFTVTVERTIVSAAEFEVEAETEEEARKLAMHDTSRFHGGELLDWEYVDEVDRQVVGVKENA